MSFVAFMAGVASSLVASAMWHVLVNFGNYVPSRYPDVRGEWEGRYIENGKELVERIFVTRQFGRRIDGHFTATDNGVKFEYRFSGRFVYHNYFEVSFAPKGKRHSDYGVGMFKVANDGEAMSGGSVSFNFSSEDLEPRSYSLRRSNCITTA